MKRYYILIGHLMKSDDDLLGFWSLKTFIDIIEAENKKEAKKKTKKQLKNKSTKKDKYVLLEIEPQTLC